MTNNNSKPNDEIDDSPYFITEEDQKHLNFHPRDYTCIYTGSISDMIDEYEPKTLIGFLDALKKKQLEGESNGDT